ncbi:MAG TPA: hypothetical protein VFJ30_01770 [Phycisphaerae bacterium]|nr:hypothetical protein [Phycisphaerae bacterium]
MARIGRWSIGPAGSRIALALSLVMAAAAGGCHKGAIQMAFYTDNHNQYPRADCTDDVFYLFEGDEYLYVDWQDVRVMRISVVRVDKNYAVRGWAADPLGVRGSDRFHVRVEGLVAPASKAEVTVMESQWGKADVPNVGTVHLLIDETQYGRARLDRVKIDFAPEFLNRVRGMVLAPPERVGDLWRFRKRTVVTDVVSDQPDGRKVDYRYVPTKLLANPSRLNVPKIRVQVSRKSVLRKVRNYAYYEEWEYWPVVPVGRGSGPMRTAPVKTERVGPLQTESKATEHPGAEGPAAGESIRFVFDVPNPPPGWAKPAYLSDRNVVADEKGVAELDLWDIIPAATLPYDSLTITVKAAEDGDQSSRPQTVELQRTELVGWYPYWLQRPR